MTKAEKKTLEDKVEDKVDLPVGPNNNDQYEIFINVKKFPIEAPYPDMVEKLALAYKGLSGCDKKSEDYKTNLKLIKSYQGNVDDLEEKLEKAKKDHAPEDDIAKLDKIHLYMSDLNKDAIALSRELMGLEVKYKADIKYECECYDSNLKKIADKEQKNLSELVEKKSALRKVGEKLALVLTAIGTYITVNYAIKQEAASIIAAVIAAIPIDYLIISFDISKRNKISAAANNQVTKEKEAHKLAKDELEEKYETKEEALKEEAKKNVGWCALKYFPKEVYVVKKPGLDRQLSEIESAVSVGHSSDV
jgi:hypothetical protein